MVTTYTCVAIPGTPSWWPNKPPLTERLFSLDLSALFNCELSEITRASVAVAPSGAGEMQISDLLVADDTMTVTCSGGVPSRVYTIMFVAALVDGTEITALVYQGIPPGLRGYPVPAPPSPGFGTVITWPSLIGFAGIPIFGRQRPGPSHYITAPALFGGF